MEPLNPWELMQWQLQQQAEFITMLTARCEEAEKYHSAWMDAAKLNNRLTIRINELSAENKRLEKLLLSRNSNES